MIVAPDTFRTARTRAKTVMLAVPKARAARPV